MYAHKGNHKATDTDDLDKTEASSETSNTRWISGAEN